MESSIPPPSHDPRKTLAAAFVIAASVLFAYRALLGLDPGGGIPNQPDAVEGALFSPADTSPALIFGTFALLLVGRRRRFSAVLGENAIHTMALPLLALGAGLNVWSYYVEVPQLLVLSASSMLLGGALWAAGRRGMAAVLMPAVYLLLAYPIPGVLLNVGMFPQQLQIAEVTAGILNATGVPSIAQGDLIVTKGRLFQVIESCSGIRSILTLLMAGMLYCELFFRSRLQVAILVIASPLIGLLVNQLRVLMITLMPGAHISSVHELQGILMVVIGVLTIAAIDLALGRILPPGPIQHAPTFVPRRLDGAAPAFPTRRIGLLASLLIGLGVATSLIPPWQPGRSEYNSVLRLGPLLRHIPTKALEVDRQYLGSIAFDELVSGTFTTESGDVDLVIAIDDRLDPRVSLISEKTAMPGRGSKILRKFPITLEPESKQAFGYVVDRGSQDAMVFHWYENIDSLPVEIVRSVLGLDRSLFRDPARTVVIRLSSTIDLQRGGEAAADARLRAFLIEIWPQLQVIDAV